MEVSKRTQSCQKPHQRSSYENLPIMKPWKLVIRVSTHANYCVPSLHVLAVKDWDRCEPTSTLTLPTLGYFLPWTCSSPFSGTVADTEYCNRSGTRDAKIHGQKEKRQEEPRSPERLRIWKAGEVWKQRAAKGCKELLRKTYRPRTIKGGAKRSVCRGKDQIEDVRNREELKEAKENTGANPVEGGILMAKRHKHIISGQVNPKNRKTKTRAKWLPSSTEMISSCYRAGIELAVEIHLCLCHTSLGTSKRLQRKATLLW